MYICQVAVYNYLSNKLTTMNTHPTFNEFVTEMMQYVFDGLITGGTKEMKARLHIALSTATQIATGNGGFRKE